MSPLHELTVQKAAIEWLQELGYSYVEGSQLNRDLKKVVLEEVVRYHLEKSYPQLPPTAVNDAMAAFTQHQGMDLDYRNRDFHLKLTKGVPISWKDKDGREQAVQVYPVNYQDPKANTFHCAEEVSVVGKNNRRADLIIFINGLQWKHYERLEFSVTGESACADSWGTALATGKVSLSIPCFAERRYGGVPDEEMLMALSPAHLAKAVEGMKQLSRNGLRYPIAPYGIQNDVRAGMGVSYGKK